MPVTTKIIKAESGSTVNESGTRKSPDANQVNTCWETTVSPDVTIGSAVQHDSANETSIAPHATAPEAGLPMRRPRLAFTRNPMNGNNGINPSICVPPRRHEDTKNSGLFLVSSDCFGSSCLPFEARERVRVQRLPMPEQRDHNREADRGLGRRHRHHEEHE